MPYIGRPLFCVFEVVVALLKKLGGHLLGKVLPSWPSACLAIYLMLSFVLMFLLHLTSLPGSGVWLYCSLVIAFSSTLIVVLFDVGLQSELFRLFSGIHMIESKDLGMLFDDPETKVQDEL